MPGASSHPLQFSFMWDAINLVEWVRASAPVGEEQAEADGLQETGQHADGNGVNRSVLEDKCGDELQG